jgi:hypothetical protein
MRTLATVLVLALLPLGATAQTAGSPSDSIRSPQLAPANAIPFGFRMGTPASEIRTRFAVTPVEGNPGVFRTTAAPTPHPEFEAYLLVTSPSEGLCKVVAMGRNFDTSDFGTQVRSHYSDIRDALTQRYGEGQEFDHVRSGSLWTESRYFMMGLVRGDRVLQTFWTRERRPDLPQNVSAIAVQAKAASAREAYINVSYEFANFDRCTRERERTLNNAF